MRNPNQSSLKVAFESYTFALDFADTMSLLSNGRLAQNVAF